MHDRAYSRAARREMATTPAAGDGQMNLPALQSLGIKRHS